LCVTEPLDFQRVKDMNECSDAHQVAGVERLQNSGLLLDLTLASDPQLLCVVRAAIERLTEVSGFSPPECRSITRAVDEAMANVMRHAYAGDPDQRIDVSCKRTSGMVNGIHREGLEIQLLDQGLPFDKNKLTARSLDEVKPGGLGLHFIRDSMDVMEHSRENGVNRLRLVKYLSADGKGQRSQGE
jgi:anti-sigma regulatory factor (Ser/Thr protein kinase)